MSNRYLIINSKTETVINIIVGTEEYANEALKGYPDCYIMKNEEALCGYIWRPDEKKFINPHIPKEISPYQMRSILVDEGLYQQVSDFITNSDDEKLKIAWEYAITIHRDSAFIKAASEHLGFSDEQIDLLFDKASKIK